MFWSFWLEDTLDMYIVLKRSPNILNINLFNLLIKNVDDAMKRSPTLFNIKSYKNVFVFFFPFFKLEICTCCDAVYD